MIFCRGAIIEGLHASIVMLSSEERIFGATCSTADLLMVLEIIDKMLFYMEEIVVYCDFFASSRSLASISRNSRRAATSAYHCPPCNNNTPISKLGI